MICLFLSIGLWPTQDWDDVVHVVVDLGEIFTKYDVHVRLVILQSVIVPDENLRQKSTWPPAAILEIKKSP